MNVEKLESLLKETGINERDYSLYGAFIPCGFILDRKPSGSYEIRLCEERSNKSIVYKFCYTESEACFYYYELILERYKRSIQYNNCTINDITTGYPSLDAKVKEVVEFQKGYNKNNR